MRLALFNFRQTVDYRLEILSGLTVAMALIPEAVAFAFIAGLSPLTGLYAAFLVGLAASVLGGRPGMISGATGAIAVLDFAESRVSDMSASEAVNKVTARYAAAGKTVHLRHLSTDCRRLLDLAEAIIEVNHYEDPTYKVVTDQTR